MEHAWGYIAWDSFLIVALAAGLIFAVVWGVRRCEEANSADWGAKWLNRLDGLNRLFCRYYHRLEFEPIPVPAEGGALLAANHVSGLDPVLMIAACTRPLRFMIATEEYNRWWLKWLYKRLGFIPVDRQGAPEKAFFAARKALNAGEIIGVFPQGRVIKPEEDTVPLKRGALVLARLANAPIIPLRVSGVAGAGKIVAAVFIRSRARIEAGNPIRVGDRGELGDALQVLEAFIASGPRLHQAQ